MKGTRREDLHWLGPSPAWIPTLSPGLRWRTWLPSRAGSTDARSGELVRGATMTLSRLVGSVPSVRRPGRWVARSAASDAREMGESMHKGGGGEVPGASCVGAGSSAGWREGDSEVKASCCWVRAGGRGSAAGSQIPNGGFRFGVALFGNRLRRARPAEVQLPLDDQHRPPPALQTHLAPRHPPTSLSKPHASMPARPGNERGVFQPDTFQGKVLFCTGGASSSSSSTALLV